jgi:hypothetical protein
MCARLQGTGNRNNDTKSVGSTYSIRRETMFICNECGFVFEEPKEYFETHGLSTPPYERWLVCPNCEDNDIVEAIECFRCGSLISEHDARVDDNLEHRYCNICYEDLYE